MTLAAYLIVLAGAVSPTAAELRAQIEREIGVPRCTETAQCRTLAVGSRACGGPEQYLPYSTLTAKPERLEQLAEAHRAARRAENQASGRLGTCIALMDPGARCVPATQRCETAGGKDEI
ncbi:hypothetical protein [Inhella sp.]|uniref:hypothetical protein n=1 Tax=Inhella sp. TaxID=1921806 RepID=UPI0035B4E642